MLHDGACRWQDTNVRDMLPAHHCAAVSRCAYEASLLILRFLSLSKENIACPARDQ